MQFRDTDHLKSDEIQLVLTRAAEADPARGRVPAYHFDICDLNGVRLGACDLRVGDSERLYYGGHIGYQVFPPYRGRHYAEKACRLLFELAREHGMERLFITCDPDNPASRRTCERLGGELLEIAELPPDNDMRVRDGKTHTCVFRFAL